MTVEISESGEPYRVRGVAYESEAVISSFEAVGLIARAGSRWRRSPSPRTTVFYSGKRGTRRKRRREVNLQRAYRRSDEGEQR
jgi:hypothetical protein